MSDEGGMSECDVLENVVTMERATGLKDANGKEIYEGDIINDDGFISAVEWDRRNAAYWLGDDPLGEMFSDAFVIGNIHDNPELLNNA